MDPNEFYKYATRHQGISEGVADRVFSIGTEQTVEVSAFAARKKIPSLGFRSSEEASPTVIGLFASPIEQGELIGKVAARVLGGEKPGGIAVETPKKVELEIDVKQAKELGLKIPMALLNAATTVKR